MQTLSLRTFLASYSFTSSFPLSYLVPSQSARFLSFTTKLPPGLFGLKGYLPSCKLILYPLFTSLFSFPSFPCPYQPHNMIFTGLFGLIGYLPSCKLILHPLLHFTLLLSTLLSMSLLPYSFLLPHQHHNMIFTGLFGLIGYLPSCKLILYPLLHFTLFLSTLLFPFFLVSLLFILTFLSFFHINITT